MVDFNDHKKPMGKRAATKDDVVGGMAAGMHAMGQKVYTQCMEQTVAMLHGLDDEFTAKLDAMEARLRAEFGKTEA